MHYEAREMLLPGESMRDREANGLPLCACFCEAIGHGAGLALRLGVTLNHTPFDEEVVLLQLIGNICSF